MPLVVDFDKCTGCRKCELACSYEKEDVFNPARSRIWIEEIGFPGIPVPLICHQCTNAPCAEVCPSDAITQNADIGAYIVDADECISCGDCVEACPWGAIALHPETDKAFKCDLCGGKPKCIEACNYGVISLSMERGETEGEPEKRRRAIAERIVEGWKASVLQRE
ncbi:MAG: 4Fe-4S dicluster domain-containing protein [Candidatus Thorarchaeota archaeon]